MYSSGSFDISRPQAHKLDDLPHDVFLLEKIQEIAAFFSSDKDIAIGKINYPDGYSDGIRQWIDLDLEIENEESDIDDLDPKVSSLAKSLLHPFQSLIEQLEKEVPGQKRVSIKVVKDQMCPLFHVDKIYARMIVTLTGTGTQWFQDKDANRQNLGKGGRKPIVKEGRFLQEVLKRQVAILKGSRCKGSKGLIHRSPPVNPKSTPRLLIRIDFA